MRTTKICKALLKKSYQLGIPWYLVLVCYIPAALLTLIYRPLWVTFFISIGVHLVLYTIYRRDNNIVHDFFASLKEKNVLEP